MVTERPIHAPHAVPTGRERAIVSAKTRQVLWEDLTKAANKNPKRCFEPGGARCLLWVWEAGQSLRRLGRRSDALPASSRGPELESTRSVNRSVRAERRARWSQRGASAPLGQVSAGLCGEVSRKYLRCVLGAPSFDSCPAGATQGLHLPGGHPRRKLRRRVGSRGEVLEHPLAPTPSWAPFAP